MQKPSQCLFVVCTFFVDSWQSFNLRDCKGRDQTDLLYLNTDYISDSIQVISLGKIPTELRDQIIPCVYSGDQLFRKRTGAKV